MNIKMKDQITLPTFKFFIKLLCFSMLLGGNISCWAAWTGIPGIYDPTTKELICPDSATHQYPMKAGHSYNLTAACSWIMPDGNGIPTSAGSHQFSIAVFDGGDGSPAGQGIYTYDRQIDPNKQFNEQDILWDHRDGSFTANRAEYAWCYILEDDTAKTVYMINNFPQSCYTGGVAPLPPGPNYLACTFNSGNALDVALGEIDRSAIGTTSGTTTKTEKSLDVTCTGEGTATYSVQFEYTPITAGSDELITTTANGLGVAMSFNDASVKTTDKVTRTYSTGTQTERLTFEPVRNPAVQASDIPTGAFTASAVMVLTEE